MNELYAICQTGEIEDGDASGFMLMRIEETGEPRVESSRAKSKAAGSLSAFGSVEPIVSLALAGDSYTINEFTGCTVCGEPACPELVEWVESTLVVAYTKPFASKK